MHICFLTHEYPKAGFPHGGIGTFIKTIGEAFVEQGHQVSVIGINNYSLLDETESIDGVTIHRLKPRRLKGVTWLLNSNSVNNCIKSIHEKNPINIIESPELGLAFIKKIPYIKYVIRLHGGHHFFSEAERRGINWWKGFQERSSFKKADAFIAVSNFVKSHTAKYLSYHDKKVDIINSPINLKIFRPKPEINSVDNTILFAGTVCEKKGIKQLILAMNKVITICPDIKLEIYGRDWFYKDGTSYIDYLKKEVIPNTGVHNNIVFKGAIPINELANSYANARLCVFPSLMETQGLVAQEAMAMKKVVIFSECGPGPEAIENKVTGLLCNPYDIESISNTIIWGLNNPEKTKEIAHNGRAFVVKNYNIDTLVEKNIEFYKTSL